MMTDNISKGFKFKRKGCEIVVCIGELVANGGFKDWGNVMMTRYSGLDNTIQDLERFITFNVITSRW